MAEVNANTPEETGLPVAQEDEFSLESLMGSDENYFGVPETKQEREVNKPDTPEKDQQKTEQQSNEEKRFAYWQSEADKNRNELMKVIEQNRQLMDKLQSVQQAPVQEQAKKDIVPESKKLEPPKRPERPSYFSREEALSDPNSISAKYLDAEDRWKTDMVLYNAELTQSLMAENAKKFEEFQQKTESEKRAAQEAAARQAQLASLANELKTKYKASDDQVAGFMQKMSQPESLTLDNLWKLYALDSGIPVNDNVSKNTPVEDKTPSDDFKQIARAQAIPNSLGVSPGISNPPGKSIEDQLMDKMLAMQANEDPFN